MSYTFFEKVNFETQSADDKENMKKYPACKELNISQVLTKERFLLKKCAKTVTVSLTTSSPLDSLYEIYYIETQFLHAIVE